MPSTGVKTDPQGNPYLELDDFWTNPGGVPIVEQLRAAGWVINDVARHSPTHIAGVTPGGRAFTLDCSLASQTLIVAGRTRTASVNVSQWLDGASLASRLNALWLSLPANQR